MTAVDKYYPKASDPNDWLECEYRIYAGSSSNIDLKVSELWAPGLRKIFFSPFKIQSNYSFQAMYLPFSVSDSSYISTQYFEFGMYETAKVGGLPTKLLWKSSEKDNGENSNGDPNPTWPRYRRNVDSDPYTDWLDEPLTLKPGWYMGAFVLRQAPLGANTVRTWGGIRGLPPHITQPVDQGFTPGRITMLISSEDEMPQNIESNQLVWEAGSIPHMFLKTSKDARND